VAQPSTDDPSAMDENYVLKDKHPIVALVTQDERQNATVIKFYSLKSQQYVHMTRLTSEIYYIASSAQAFVAVSI